ncbi:FMN-dependent NADH-azoreductase [Caenispirillum bisanense]|uniref:FMN dependent NADH:quinone oxidoreductase n=1 Tax=Caenispirillum bisanense TaxID=414052 RepID=A0A286G6D1_9PROT|nr:NAD(P)H-dependent oxidoreductase [Caenispirillum bisanense]SOD91063.1 FMN-dependent NADH-azoreductase [Caenispirillum bisanense]
MTLLHLDSSPLAGASASRRLTAAIVAAAQEANPALAVVYRDLAAAPPAHLGGDALAPRGLPADQLTEAQKAEAAVTEELIAEFLAADVVVVGAPMYNFSIPSQLKAWIDRVAAAGRTFKYTETGPVGLSGGKTVIVASTRGGLYSEGPASAMDHQESYLKTVFAFLGITDVRFVRAERLSLGGDQRAQAMDAALAGIQAVLPVAEAA